MYLRRASVHMFAGLAGTYKTMVLLNALINMGVPSLVFSTDSDEATVSSRYISIKSRVPTKTTEEWLSPSSPNLGRAVGYLETLDFLRFDFTPSPSLDDIWNTVYAYGTVEGRWPEIIVVDIASDVGHDTGDEWGSLRSVMREAKVMARETRAAVLLVHHVSEGWNPSAEHPVPPRRAVMGKLSALPVLMVNFGMDSRGDLCACGVKNRYAKADATGREFFRMRVDPSTAFVGDWIPGASMLPPKGGDGEDWWNSG